MDVLRLEQPTNPFEGAHALHDTNNSEDTGTVKLDGLDSITLNRNSQLWPELRLINNPATIQSIIQQHQAEGREVSDILHGEDGNFPKNGLRRSNSAILISEYLRPPSVQKAAQHSPTFIDDTAYYSDTEPSDREPFGSHIESRDSVLGEPETHEQDDDIARPANNDHNQQEIFPVTAPISPGGEESPLPHQVTLTPAVPLQRTNHSLEDTDEPKLTHAQAHEFKFDQNMSRAMHENRKVSRSTNVPAKTSTPVGSSGLRETKAASLKSPCQDAVTRVPVKNDTSQVRKPQKRTQKISFQCKTLIAGAFAIATVGVSELYQVVAIKKKHARVMLTKIKRQEKHAADLKFAGTIDNNEFGLPGRHTGGLIPESPPISNTQRSRKWSSTP